jgi:hypothetical protein
MLSKSKVVANQRKQQSAHLSDDRVRDSLYAQGFYDSWITPELIKAQRKVMEARLRRPYQGKSKSLIPGEYD